jgi:tetratricopeptide (TPR) repeat protein
MFSFAARNLTLRFLFISILAAIISTSIGKVHAQGGVGSTRGLPTSTAGTDAIQGRVFFPDPGSTRRLRVSLQSVNYVSQSTLTDEDGVFHFNQLETGSYTVSVDVGKEYDPAIETVLVEQRFVNVTIYLKAKPDPSIPQAAVDFYRKGQEFARKGNNIKAVEQFSSALALSPQFAAALSELGVQYMKLAQMDKAAQTLESFLKLKPDDPLGQLNLGVALYNQSVALYGEKKVDESNQKAIQAQSHLQTAIKLKSSGPSAHYYLGLTLIRLRQYEAAQKELELAISNGGENLAPAHKFLGGIYMSTHKSKEAADELEKYLQLDPKAEDAAKIRNTIQNLRSKP